VIGTGVSYSGSVENPVSISADGENSNIAFSSASSFTIGG
jgi:hypothetical protein